MLCDLLATVQWLTDKQMQWSHCSTIKLLHCHYDIVWNFLSKARYTLLRMRLLAMKKMLQNHVFWRLTDQNYILLKAQWATHDKQSTSLEYHVVNNWSFQLNLKLNNSQSVAVPHCTSSDHLTFPITNFFKHWLIHLICE